jgi:hypothetical protein
MPPASIWNDIKKMLQRVKERKRIPFLILTSKTFFFFD